MRDYSYWKRRYRDVRRFTIPSVGQSDDFGDMGSSDDGFGFDEEGVEDENGKIINPMEDIEDADLSLTTELRGSNFCYDI